jgi:ankyrin repeat protein
VAFLLNLGSSYNYSVSNGSTTLHIAAENSSALVVSMLLEQGHFVDTRDHAGRTPLMYTTVRRDEEGLEIANVLLGYGANLAIQSNSLMTALHYACKVGTLKMVMLLGPRKHDIINVADNQGHTPLMAACYNVYDGEEIIPYLISAGADANRKSTSGWTALGMACRKNAALVRSIRSFVGPEQLQSVKGCVFHTLKHGTSADMLGVFRESHVFGNPNSFKSAVEQKFNLSSIWAILRSCTPCLNGSNLDYYTVLRELAPKDARLWDMVAANVSGGRHPITGDTTLHASVRTGCAESVAAVFRRLPNPFLRNIAGETPLDVAYGLPQGEERRKIIVCLKFYAQWKPSNVCADWYGPFFCRRAKAFLLVAQRLKLFPRDIVLMILKRVADLEYV